MAIGRRLEAVGHDRIRPRLARALAAALGTVLVWVLLPTTEVRAADGDLVLEQVLSEVSPRAFGEYGKHVALDGDRLAVYVNQTGESTAPPGPAAIRYYRRQATTWQFQRTLTLPNWVSSIDLSGDTLAVSMPHQQSGQVRIYSLDQPAAQPAIIADPLDEPVDIPYSGFGSDVAIDGDRLVVGVNGDPGQRYALFYERSASGWTPAPGGTINPGAVGAFYGRRVDVSHDLAVVSDGSAAYVYRRTASGWGYEDAIPSPTGTQLDPDAGALVSEEQIVLVPNVFETGTKAYVYGRNGSSWSQSQQLPLTAGFLTAAVGGNELAVFSVDGVVQLWERKASGWVAATKMTVQPDGTQFDVDWRYTSPAMDVSAGRVVLGIPEARPGDNYDAGSVRMLRRGGTGTTPPGGASQVAVSASRTTGTATIGWRAATGQVGEYHVSAVPQTPTAPGAVRVVSAGTRSVTFSGLREFATYRFSVRASGPGGGGPLVTSAPATLGGPRSVSSPYVRSDPRDATDARQDIQSLTVEATGAAVTLRLHTRAPRNPYTDAIFRRPTGSRFYVTWRVPAQEWTSIFDHTAINDGLRIPGEDFTLRFKVPRPCRNPDAVFPARYVDGAYQATVPSRCFQYSRALRFSARGAVSGDSTSLTPPISRLGSKGSVSVSKVKVSSIGLGPTGEGKRTISFTARHSSGIRSATIRTFSLSTGQRPLRIGNTTCVRKSKKTSVCKATIRLRPGEIRDQDAGRWRVFVEVKTRGTSVGVKEDVKRFSVRRSTRVGNATAKASGRRLAIAATVTGARWNTGGWVARAGTTVIVERKAPGSKKYKRVTVLRTDAKGALKATVTTSTSGKFRLRVPTRSTYAATKAKVTVTR